MKTLRYIVLALIFLILVAVVVGFFLPSKVHLERSVEIQRDKTTIFKVINAFENFNKWSPWYELDINAQYSVSGPQSGVGSKLEWHGNENVGDGVNEIVESVNNDHIKTKMFFGKSDAPAYSIISLEQRGDSTKVTWAFENDFGMNVFYRYFGLVIEDMIAPDYERGLNKLKTYVESMPKFDFSSVSIESIKPKFIYTYTSQSINIPKNIELSLALAFKKIIAFLSAHSIDMNGTPKVIRLDSEENIFKFKTAIPVINNKITDPAGEVIGELSYQGKVVKVKHKGAYKYLNDSYKTLAAFMKHNNLEVNGNSWEDFISDPGTVTEKELITYIYQPIK